jgi:hypothetical protein
VNFKNIIYKMQYKTDDGSQWSSGLRRGSGATRLLGLRFGIPPGTMMSLVGIMCCQTEVSASGWSLVQRNPNECGVSECDRESSIKMRPWFLRRCCAMKKKSNRQRYYITCPRKTNCCFPTSMRINIICKKLVCLTPSWTRYLIALNF